MTGQHINVKKSSKKDKHWPTVFYTFVIFVLTDACSISDSYGKTNSEKYEVNIVFRCMLLQASSCNQGQFKPRSVRENKNPTDLHRTLNERLNQSMVCSRAARLPSASTNVLKTNMLFSLKMWNLPSRFPNSSHQNPQAPPTPNKTLLLEPSQVSKPSQAFRKQTTSSNLVCFI